MGDEVLAGAATLVGVVLARERERARDRVAVDRLRRLVGVLGDDREQVLEQVALVARELGGGRGACLRRGGGCIGPVAVPGALGLADRRAVELLAGDRDGALAGAAVPARAVAPAGNPPAASLPPAPALGGARVRGLGHAPSLPRRGASPSTLSGGLRALATAPHRRAQAATPVAARGSPGAVSLAAVRTMSGAARSSRRARWAAPWR
jgi:hypothetical protein